jgi:hypothetical protein
MEVSAMRSIWLLIVIGILIIIGGCMTHMAEDGTKTYSLLPSVEKGLNQVEQVGGLLATVAPLFGPVGGIVAGGLVTGLTILKKARPKLKDAQDKYQLSNTVAAISVDALEQIKKNHPEVWTKLSERLQKECEDSGLDTKLVKNAIRGLRGLPAKV